MFLNRGFKNFLNWWFSFSDRFNFLLWLRCIRSILLYFRMQQTEKEKKIIIDTEMSTLNIEVSRQSMTTQLDLFLWFVTLEMWNEQIQKIFHKNCPKYTECIHLISFWSVLSLVSSAFLDGITDLPTLLMYFPTSFLGASTFSSFTTPFSWSFTSLVSESESSDLGIQVIFYAGYLNSYQLSQMMT